MKRIITVCIALVLLMCMVAGCASKATQSPPNTTTTQSPPNTTTTKDDYKWPASFVLTCPNTGVQYANFLGWSAVFQKSTGCRTRVIPNDVTSIRAAMVRDGIVSLDGEPIGSFTYIMEATTDCNGPDAGPFQVRVGYLSTVSVRGYIVRADSSIKTIYDIKKGVRIAEPPQAGIKNKNKALLAWVGLNYDDAVHIQFGNLDETLTAVADGRCDIVNTGFTGANVMELANNPKGIRVLDLPFKEDPKGAARWLAVNPVETLGICDPVNTSIKEAVGTGCIDQVYYHFWSADADQDLVYHVTKWFAENYDQFKNQETSLGTMTIENFRKSLDYTPLPVAEGTIRYLKEIGMWSETDVARQARNIDQVNKYIAAWEEAKKMAGEQGITIDTKNKQWIDLWENYKKELKLEPFTVIS